MIWTPEADALVTQRWAEGISATLIGLELGTTKNSICGRVHRLRLRPHARTHPPGVDRLRKPRKKRPSRAKAKLAVVSESRVSKPALKLVPTTLPKRDALGHFISAKPKPKPSKKEGEPITILELNGHTCRWPFGKNPPYLYCGKSPEEGLPYCEEHSRIAFTGTRAKVENRISARARF